MTNNRWIVLAIVSCALLLIVIDMTVLYTALPRLTHDLHATASQKLWIINAYPLVVAGLLPGTGTLGDRIGHRTMFLSGLVVFGFASTAAAFAPSANFLIGARVGLAIGAAMMMPATLSIIRITFQDEKERAIALGIWSSIAAGGAAIGPVVGGVLLEYFWWGSVFLINVPVVIIALIIGMIVLEKRGGNKDRAWDFVGSVQIMLALIALTFALKELGKPERDLSLFAVAFVVGLIAAIVFVKRQNKRSEPLLDFQLFKNTKFSSGVLTASIASASLIGVELVFTQRLQLVSGYSPLQAGLLILPIPLAAFIAAPLMGFFMNRIGTAKALFLSLGMTGIGIVLYLLTFNWESMIWLLPLIIVGFGTGAAMTGASTAIMGNASAEKAGMAASIEEVSYELGGSIGVTVMGSLMTAIYSFSLVLPDFATQNPVFAKAATDSLDGAKLLAETLPADQVDMLLSNAYQAFDKSFVIVIAVAAIGVFTTAFAVYRLNRTQ
ncbi:MFS transporter [Brucellaceae bacterium C25G]